MNLKVNRIIKRPAFQMAISPDRTKIATFDERAVTVYSYPDFDEIDQFKVAHASTMVFLSDSVSLFVTNTTGGAFLWDGTTLKKLGKWKVPGWEGKPAFLSGDDCVVAASFGGIYQYNIVLGTTRNIFPTERCVRVCRCENEEIKCVVLEYGSIGEADIYVLSLNGQIKHHAKVDCEIYDQPMRSVEWSDDDKIICNSRIADGVPFDIIYLMDMNGETLAQELVPYMENLGCSFYYDRKIFTKVVTVGSGNICFYRTDDLTLIGKLDKQLLNEYGISSPLTFASFTPDGKLLVGSWKNLYLFEMF